MVELLRILEVYSIFWNFLDYFKSRKSIIASALRLGDVSRVNRPVQVKPDHWGPLVSETDTNPALTPALTRCGARCQRLQVVQVAGLVLMTRPRRPSPEFRRRQPKLRRQLTGLELQTAVGRAETTRR